MPRLSFEQLAQVTGISVEEARADPDRSIEKFKELIEWRREIGDIVIIDRTDIKASVSDMAKGVMTALAGGARRMLLNQSALVPKKVAQARLDICKQCEHFRPETRRCSACGCTTFKHTLASSSCILGKWDSYEKEGS